MRRPSILIASAAFVLVLVATSSVVAYDSSRSDTIAPGVKVGTVDVGGLTAREAAAKLRADMVQQLRRRLVVRAGEREFPLTAREARIAADVEAMVAAAVARGRAGSIVARTWRGVTGAAVDARIQPRVAYSLPAVRRLVDKVRVTMTRKARNAEIAVAGGRVEVRRARDGLSVDAKALRPQIERALVNDIDGDRSLRVKLERTKPKVSTQQLATKYPVLLTVERSRFRINLFKKLKLAKSYPIAVGQAGLETPAGRYTITNKAVNPAWSVPNSPWAGSLAGTVVPGGIPSNPLKARWLGIYDGVGVHGTDVRGSIGTNASHGCIRMLVEDVVKLYDQVPVGTPIYIN